DDAQPALVPARITTDRAEGRVADVEALLAEDDLVANGDEGRGKGSCFALRCAQEVVGQALGRLRPDAWQPVEGLDEACHRLDEDICHAGPVSGPAARRGRRRDHRGTTSAAPPAS